MKDREIERKFLVCGDFKKYSFKESRITQGYLNSAPERTVRVRICSGRGFITIKGISTGATRFEWEKEIPLADAEELLELSEPGKIDKTRYLVRNTDGIHIWEVDEFHGDNEGLVVAEVELSYPDEAFDKPDWLGDEVTDDPRYYNSTLKDKPYTTWKR